jgi:SIR2-like domain
MMAFKIFPQLIERALKPTSAGLLDPAYTRLIQLLRKNNNRQKPFWDAGGTAPTFYFHTLNHDLFLESLLDDETAHTSIGYSDGFSEEGTPYFGRIDFGYEFPPRFRQYPPYAHVRIPRYTGNYEGEVQLFKLHGSKNYWSFGVDPTGTGAYEPGIVKMQPWISSNDLYREVEADGKIFTKRDFSNYFPLFLSGTTAKIEQYDDPVLFSKLLQKFSQNLAESDILVIIGYGFRDNGINARIESFLRDSSKKTIIISPYPPTHLDYVTPDMIRLGGLEDYDFEELQQSLDTHENTC